MKILKCQHLDKSTDKNEDLQRYWGHDKATLEKFHVGTRRELKQKERFPWQIYIERKRSRGTLRIPEDIRKLKNQEPCHPGKKNYLSTVIEEGGS